MIDLTIGFIGQGWIGKHYADDFESRGYTVVRYSTEPQHVINAAAIGQCDIVFIAVPTPTVTVDGTQRCDISIVREVLHLVGEGKIAVIKSTIPPGTTQRLQGEFPTLWVFHSPEFLTEANAAYDASHPERNIVGVPSWEPVSLSKAQFVHSVLPIAAVDSTVSSTAAELVKYAGNAFLYMKVVFANVLYDLTHALGAEWGEVASLVGYDPRIGSSHMNPVKDGGRGAGGHCFIKDFAALRDFYSDHLPKDSAGIKMLAAIEFKNLTLLSESNKDRDLVASTYQC